MDVCNIRFLGYVFRFFWLPCIVLILHIPTFQWHWSFFHVYGFASIHRALSFYYHFKYPVQFETVELHDTAKSDESSPWFQTQCCNENKNHQHWSIQFFSVCLSVVHYCCLEFYSCIDDNFFPVRPSSESRGKRWHWSPCSLRIVSSVLLMISVESTSVVLMGKQVWVFFGWIIAWKTGSSF